MNKPQEPTEVSFVKKWIGALRSGDYAQGNGFLHHTRTNAYCCLGVACDLDDALVEETGGGAAGKFYSKQDAEAKKRSSFMPSGEWGPVWELLSDNGPDGASSFLSKLIDFNDEEGYTFDQIADYIEETILPLVEAEFE